MQDIIDLSRGDAVLEMSGGLEIPPELAEFDDFPKKKTKSLTPEVDGEVVNDNQDDDVTQELLYEIKVCYLCWGIMTELFESKQRVIRC